MEIITGLIPALRGASSSPLASPQGGSEKLVLKTKKGFVFLQKEEIQWIEAQGPCCLIHCGSEPIRVRRSITDFEHEMDPRMFVRVSRSAVLNLSHVRMLRPWRKGDYEVIMNDGSALHWSRSFKGRLKELIGAIRVTTAPQVDM